MPNDAKFGLAVGVALVIAAAVLFKSRPPSDPSAPAAEVRIEATKYTK